MSKTVSIYRANVSNDEIVADIEGRRVLCHLTSRHALELAKWGIVEWTGLVRTPKRPISMRLVKGGRIERVLALTRKQQRQMIPKGVSRRVGPRVSSDPTDMQPIDLKAKRVLIGRVG